MRAKLRSNGCAASSNATPHLTWAVQYFFGSFVNGEVIWVWKAPGSSSAKITIRQLLAKRQTWASLSSRGITTVSILNCKFSAQRCVISLFSAPPNTTTCCVGRRGGGGGDDGGGNDDVSVPLGPDAPAGALASDAANIW